MQSKAKKQSDRIQGKRRAFLAMVHIAKKDLGMLEDDYRDILVNEFGVSSSAALSLGELERLVNRMKDCGWTPKPGKKSKTGQVEALRERARAVAAELENGEKRLNGLVRKICRVERLSWARDVEKLKRLIAVLERLQ